MTGSEEKRREMEEILLGLIQSEYRQCGEIEDLTGQIASAMDRDDQVSIRMVLKMRGEAMDELEKIRRQEIHFLDACGEWRERMQTLMGGGGVSDMTEAEQRIRALCGNRKDILKRTIDLDQKLSKRLAGEKSFYSR